MMRMGLRGRPTHHSAYPGTPIQITLKNGTVINGKYRSGSDRYIFLRSGERYLWKHIKKFRVTKKHPAKGPR